jgi:hypothetical protein
MEKMSGRPVQGRRLPTLVLIGLALFVLPAAWERDGPLSPPHGDPETSSPPLGLVEPFGRV